LAAPALGGIDHSSFLSGAAVRRTGEERLFETLQTDRGNKSRGDYFYVETKGETMRRQSGCKGRTKTGKPCGAAATAGGLCFFHANPNKASELGRIGGRSKRHAAAESGDPLPTLDNAVALRDTVAHVIADVLAGKVQPRVAACLAPLMNLQLHAIKTADIEQRLTKLEQQSKLRGRAPDEPPAAPDQHRESRAESGEVGDAVS
jgi:hypothetical protein